jgi:hypothetical protein
MGPDFGAGIGCGMAIGIGSGMSIGIGSGAASAKKKFMKQIENAIADNLVTISSPDGSRFTAEQFIKLLDDKYKKI